MKTVQMTFDDELLTIVDTIVKREGTTRSAFTRDALRTAIERYTTKQLEQKQIQGYKNAPPAAGEFDDWTDEQAWGD
jgi:metal-responsive CopG/Arc/MetJ family transcriptional regulator